MQNEREWYHYVKVPDTKVKPLTYLIFCYALMRGIGYGRFVSVCQGLKFFLGYGVRLPKKEQGLIKR